MVELELEKTYVAKKLPDELTKFPHKEVDDVYFPAEAVHPVLRLRKKTGTSGSSYEMTKKEPVDEADASTQTEHTIKLTAAEYAAFATLSGKRVRKIRYDYPHKGFNAEIAVFKDALEGLVLVDVEFKSAKDMASFGMPDFCLADVTDDDTFAGGMLCGKSYMDIEGQLNELGYVKIEAH